MSDNPGCRFDSCTVGFIGGRLTSIAVFSLRISCGTIRVVANWSCTVWVQFGRSIDAVGSRSGHGLVMVGSRSGHGLVKVWSRSGHGLVTVWSRSGYCLVTVWLVSGHGMVTVWRLFGFFII